ncbi:hypothetical protein ACSBR1_007745 [Camellia fascicularis]
MNVRSEMHNIDSKSNCRDYLSTGKNKERLRRGGVSNGALPLSLSLHLTLILSLICPTTPPISRVYTSRCGKSTQLIVLRSRERRDTTRRSISDASEVEPKSHLDDSKVKKLGSKISATIPAAKKANLKAKVSVLQTTEVAASDGKAFCISRVNVGLDTTAMREAVVKVMDEKGIAVMVFSTDETANKALVCAGVPEKGDKCKQLKVLEWLVAALKPLKGKGGGGKGGLAQGQVRINQLSMWE